MLVDSARAVAEALVVRQGSEPDPHWNDKAVQVITAILVLVLMRFEGEDRSLNSVQEIASDPKMLAAAADKLREMGGIPARLGNQLKVLFDKEQAGALSKEGAGVLSTVARHLAFLDSELVARSVARSTFDPAVLLKPGTTLFLQIPPDQLEAQKGLLRCWISTLVRMIGAAGDERAGEVLFLVDEASALGFALGPGRSVGARPLRRGASVARLPERFAGAGCLQGQADVALRQLHDANLPRRQQHRNRRADLQEPWRMDAGARRLRREHFPLVERRRLPIRPGPASQSGQLLQLLRERQGFAQAGRNFDAERQLPDRLPAGDASYSGPANQVVQGPGFQARCGNACRDSGVVGAAGGSRRPCGVGRWSAADVMFVP